jgi:PTS system nitrogen regulatory IIA component
MSDLSDILSIQAIDADMVAANKKALIQQLGAAAGRLSGVPAKQIVSCLNAREKIGSTGFGAGTAIPHAKLEGLTQVFGYFARLTQPVDFQAIDGMPVDLVFLLLSPSDAGADHL